MKNDRDEWIKVGVKSKLIVNYLYELKKESNDFISKDVVKKISQAINAMNVFRNEAENEMFLDGIDETNIFYGMDEPIKTIDNFLKENIEKDLIGERVSSKDLYETYLDWSHVNRFKPMTRTAFGIEMTKRFKKIKSNGIYYIISGDRDA